MVLFFAFINCFTFFSKTLALPNVFSENDCIHVHYICFPIDLKTNNKDENVAQVLQPACTTLIYPLNGADDIIPATNISWLPVSGATGYLISIGTSPGVYDIFSDLDVGNVTTFDPPNPLPPGSDIYVVVTPYDTTGLAVGCAEEMFTIRDLLPDCTIMSFPGGNTYNNPVDTDISWFPVQGAIGYFINIGTDSGLWDIVDTLDLGNVTTYNHPIDLPVAIEIFVLITPYRVVGETFVSCEEEAFGTGLYPDCTNLNAPLNNTQNVSVGTNISWNAVAGATGYSVNIGTSSGATDIANGVDVGNSTTFNPPTDLPEDMDIFVTIIPYNNVGNAMGCTEEVFTTETLATIPDCTSLNLPLNGSVNVSISTDLSWNAIADADGYLLTIGTTSGGNDIVNTIDVGNVTTYDLGTDLSEATDIFVTIIPYNSVGTATGCTEESFTTETLATIPDCTSLNLPLNGSVNVPISADLSWNAIADADGYLLTIGTTSGGNDIVNTIDVGNVTTYDLGTDLPEATDIFVTIIPYNSVGTATGCTEESFTTETSATIPDCTSLILPLEGSVNVSSSTDLSWNTEPNANGYLLTIVSSTEGILLDSFDVGNVTTYNPTIDFMQGSTINVLIIPYNENGNASGCSEEGFTILANPPECAYMTFPSPGAIEVPVDIPAIIWNPPDSYSVAGYYLTIGLSPNGGEILNNVDVGNGIGYYLLGDLPENQLIYVTVAPYNYVGTAVNCETFSFKTEGPKIIIPKFFTPNGDHSNEVWQVKDPNHIVKTINIFDRYGKLLHTMNTTTIGWNGTYNNRPLPSTDYWYHLFLKDGQTLSGHLTLKR